MSQNTPQGDPLESYGRENRAAPNPAQHTGGGGNGVTASQKTLTAEEKNQCPYGDTRWPSANASIFKPLHLLSDEGEEPIYYHLLHENNNPQVEFWKGTVKAQATAAYAEKGLALQILKEGKSKKEFKAAKERALEDDAPKATMEIRQARDTKMLRELSSGPRGTIWQLDEEHLHV
ncbi:hypothetical protein J4E91_010945 [Alternaria rosae]|nr:hypothetical protein J4E91_010945 [Alternaria rosae]